MQSKFPDRFEILAIDKVQEKIRHDFLANEPFAQEKLDLVFKNATMGLPVLPSDVYRIIGMYYGHEQAQNHEKNIYTYSDIDTFCFGMRGAHQHQDLISALFQIKIIETSFYLGKIEGNNDVIKLQIIDLTVYEKFCIAYLTNLSGYVFWLGLCKPRSWKYRGDCSMLRTRWALPTAS